MVFKFPAHKKKLHQFLAGQVSRFETQQKSKRRGFIQNDIREILLGLFQAAFNKNPEIYFSISIQDIKDDRKTYLEKIEKKTFKEMNRYLFPETHL
jgi:hypothetical protein